MVLLWMIQWCMLLQNRAEIFKLGEEQGPGVCKKKKKKKDPKQKTYNMLWTDWYKKYN